MVAMDMPKPPQADVFAIIVLIACVLIVVFLIVSLFAFYNSMNFRYPSQGQSMFLFWTSLIMAIVFIGLGIYSLYRIFTYKAPVIKEEIVTTTSTTVKPVAVSPQPITTIQQPAIITTPQPVITQQPAMITTPQPVVAVSNVPTSSLTVADFSKTLSDIPINQAQKNALTSELISISNAMAA